MPKKVYKVVYAVILLCIFLFMLYCNTHTPYVADDWSYQWDFSDGDGKPHVGPSLDAGRITSIFQIFPSMVAHRTYMNGRVIAHFLVQLFLMLPKNIFDVVNSVLFVLGIVLILYCSTLFGRKIDNIAKLIFIIGIFAAIWIFQPTFGQVNLWLDGSINYLWSGIVALVYIMIFIRWYLSLDIGNNIQPKKSCTKIIFYIKTFAITAFSFIVGAWCEGVAIAMIVFASLLILCKLIIHREHVPFYIYLYDIATILGLIFVATSPAESSKVSKTFSIYYISYRLVEIFDVLREYWILWAASIALLVLAIVSKSEKKIIVISCVLFISAVASSFCMVMASYIAKRCFFITVILLILVICIISANTIDRFKYIIYPILSILIMVFPYYLSVGFLDISTCATQYEANTAYLESCSNNKDFDVYLPYVLPTTKYSAQYALDYISSEANSMPNMYMAKYYDVRSVNIK